MCIARAFRGPKIPDPKPAIFAAPDNTEATRAASLEAALRRRRAGAAADILTSPTGIPATATMGGVA
jgi:hypothetical protein